MLNRAALMLRYKAPAIRWINESDPSPDGYEISAEEVNRERVVYLVDEAVADSSELLRQWLQDNFDILFENELEGWYTDPGLWPEKITMKLFDEWFSVECHSMIVDTLAAPLLDDEL